MEIPLFTGQLFYICWDSVLGDQFFNTLVCGYPRFWVCRCLIFNLGTLAREMNLSVPQLLILISYAYMSGLKPQNAKTKQNCFHWYSFFSEKLVFLMNEIWINLNVSPFYYVLLYYALHANQPTFILCRIDATVAFFLLCYSMLLLVLLKPENNAFRYAFDPLCPQCFVSSPFQ